MPVSCCYGRWIENSVYWTPSMSASRILVIPDTSYTNNGKDPDKDPETKIQTPY
jgi:hypothetical protein